MVFPSHEFSIRRTKRTVSQRRYAAWRDYPSQPLWNRMAPYSSLSNLVNCGHRPPGGEAGAILGNRPHNCCIEPICVLDYRHVGPALTNEGISSTDWCFP